MTAHQGEGTRRGHLLRRDLRRVGGCAACMLLLLGAGHVEAQTTGQLWGAVILDKVKSDRLTFELVVEPKVLLSAPSGDAGWWTLDATPTVDYAAKDWLDLVGEFATGYTSQTNDVDSVELTPRGGVRVHFLSRDLPTLGELGVPERSPKRRIVLRDLARVEARNLVYTRAGQGTSSTVRVRNRLEFLAPLNKEKLSANGVRYVLADWEWFVPLGDPAERFANRQRIRAGYGYRRNLRWRVEALYIWNRSRNTIEDGYRTTDHVLDFRVKRVF